MKTVFTILSLFLCYSPTVRSQSLHIDSTRFITGHECCTQIRYSIPTADKGILFVGYTSGNPGGIIPLFPIDTVLENVLIGKIDSNQQISWIKVHGGSQDDAGGPACQTPDGGYAILAGTTSNDGDVTGFKGGVDIWLLRLDDSGNLLWEKCYGSSQSDGPVSIANTPDHGFIILGSTNGSDDDVPFHYGDIFSMDWLVIKIDSLGNVQWSNDYGTTGNEGDGSILSIDNNYYIVSSSDSNNHDCTDTAWHPGVYTGPDIYILKLDKAGHVQWDSSYGGSHGEYANYALFDPRDSTIVAIGWTYSGDYMVSGYHGGGDIWVIKVNKNGTLIWEKPLGGPNQEGGNGLCTVPSGGYMAYGSTYPGPIGFADCWLFNIDNSGNEITNKILGGTEAELPYSFVPYLNGYIASGISASTVFTEGITNGRNCIGEEGFISYINYWPLLVSEVNNDPHLLLCYPNPAFVNLKIIVPIRPGSISIINIIGQIVYFDEIITPKVLEEINIDNWDKGIYIVRWQGEDGTSLVEKLVCL